MVHKILGGVSLLNIFGLALDMMFFRSEQLLTIFLIATAPSLIAAKWSIYTPEWRWHGLTKVSPSVILICRWAVRLMILLIIGVGVFSVIAPERIAGLGLREPALILRHLGSTMLILLNLWFCGFVLFGDQTAASPRVRQQVDRVKSRLFAPRK